MTTEQPWKCLGTVDGHHQYRIACSVCKEPGTLFVSIEPGDVQRGVAEARATAQAEVARWRTLARTAYLGWRTGDDIVGPMNVIRAALADEPAEGQE